jgi:hypothetical protein
MNVLSALFQVIGMIVDADDEIVTIMRFLLK